MNNETINKWMQEGVQLHLAGNRAGAESNYRKVLETEESNPVAHNNLGFLLAQNGQWKAAMEEYSRAIELSPDYSTPYTNLGQAFLALNRLAEAGTLLTKAVELDPDDFYANEGMSKLCLLAGDLASGERFLKKSYSLEPGNELLYQLVLCLLGLRKHDEARDILQALGGAGENDVRWHNLWGLLHFAENNFGAAGRAFRRALGLEPENVEVRNSLAAVLLKTGEREEAVAELRRMLLLDPGHLEALLNLGVLQLMAADYTAALGYLDKALEVEPGNVKGLFYKAVALARQNKKKATARNLLEKVVRSKDAIYSGKATELLETLT
jgi:Flp pilus assembly protein TadD